MHCYLPLITIFSIIVISHVLNYTCFLMYFCCQLYPSLYTVSPKKPDTCIMVNNFHKHRAISVPFDRLVRATVLDNLL